MLMVGVQLLSKLTILVMTPIAAPSGSTFFWMGFCIITWICGSNFGAGSLGVIGGMPISFWSQAALIGHQVSLKTLGSF